MAYRGNYGDNYMYTPLTFEEMYGDSEYLQQIKDHCHEQEINHIFVDDEIVHRWDNFDPETQAFYSELLDKLNEKSMHYGFQVKAAQNGIYMMPVVDGQVIEEEEFDKLEQYMLDAANANEIYVGTEQQKQESIENTLKSKPFLEQFIKKETMTVCQGWRKPVYSYRCHGRD